MWDQCLYLPDWKIGEDYDALTEEWSAELKWINPPFSRTLEFLYKALIEFLKGRSSVLLVPNRSIKRGIEKNLI